MNNTTGNQAPFLVALMGYKLLQQMTEEQMAEMLLQLRPDLSPLSVQMNITKLKQIVDYYADEDRLAQAMDDFDAQEGNND